MSVSSDPSFAIHCQANVASASPSSSAMSAAEAVSVSPTRAVPVIAGRPVGAMLAAPTAAAATGQICPAVRRQTGTVPFSGSVETLDAELSEGA